MIKKSNCTFWSINFIIILRLTGAISYSSHRSINYNYSIANTLSMAALCGGNQCNRDSLLHVVIKADNAHA